MGAPGPSIFWHTVHIHNGFVQQNRVCHEQSFDIPPVLNEVLAKGPLFVLLSAQKLKSVSRLKALPPQSANIPSGDRTAERRGCKKCSGRRMLTIKGRFEF